MYGIDFFMFASCEALSHITANKGLLTKKIESIYRWKRIHLIDIHATLTLQWPVEREGSA